MLAKRKRCAVLFHRHTGPFDEHEVISSILSGRDQVAKLGQASVAASGMKTGMVPVARDTRSRVLSGGENSRGLHARGRGPRQQTRAQQHQEGRRVHPALFKKNAVASPNSE